MRHIWKYFKDLGPRTPLDSRQILSPRAVVEDLACVVVVEAISVAATITAVVTMAHDRAYAVVETPKKGYPSRCAKFASNSATTRH